MGIRCGIPVCNIECVQDRSPNSIQDFTDAFRFFWLEAADSHNTRCKPATWFCFWSCPDTTIYSNCSAQLESWPDFFNRCAFPPALSSYISVGSISLRCANFEAYCISNTFCSFSTASWWCTSPPAYPISSIHAWTHPPSHTHPWRITILAWKIFVFSWRIHLLSWNLSKAEHLIWSSPWQK